ncbi:hypothetical protein DNTS_026663, partial [Danionella cerebrum]
KSKSSKSKQLIPKNLLDSRSLKFIVGLHDRTTKSLLHLHKKKRPPSISAQFQTSLGKLLETLGRAEPFFIRCLRSNAEKKEMCFDEALLVQQLRYTGMLETVRIRHSGYGAKYTFQEFTEQFRVLLPKNASSPEEISALLHKFGFHHTTYQIGKTKVYLKELERQKLQDILHKDVMCKIIFLQRWFRSKIERMEFVRMREAAILIQTAWRGLRQRGEYQKTRSSITKIQALARGLSARKRYETLKEERRKKFEEEARQKEKEAARAKEAEEVKRTEELASQAKEKEAFIRRLNEEEQARKKEQDLKDEKSPLQPMAPIKNTDVGELALERCGLPVEAEFREIDSFHQEEQNNPEKILGSEAGPQIEIKSHKDQSGNQSQAISPQTQTAPRQNRAPPLSKLPPSRSQEKRELRRQRGLEHNQRESERAASAGKDDPTIKSETLESPGTLDKLKEETSIVKDYDSLESKPFERNGQTDELKEEVLKSKSLEKPEKTVKFEDGDYNENDPSIKSTSLESPGKTEKPKGGSLMAKEDSLAKTKHFDSPGKPEKLKERSNSKELDQYTFVAWKGEKKRDPEPLRPTTLPLDIPNSGSGRNGFGDSGQSAHSNEDPGWIKAALKSKPQPENIFPGAHSLENKSTEALQNRGISISLDDVSRIGLRGSAQVGPDRAKANTLKERVHESHSLQEISPIQPSTGFFRKILKKRPQKEAQTPEDGDLSLTSVLEQKEATSPSRSQALKPHPARRIMISHSTNRTAEQWNTSLNRVITNANELRHLDEFLGNQKPQIGYKSLMNSYQNKVLLLAKDKQKGELPLVVNLFQSVLDGFIRAEIKKEEAEPAKPPKGRKNRRKKEKGSCDQCTSFIWGMEKAFMCSYCKMVCHKKCISKITVDCSSFCSRKCEDEAGSHHFGVHVGHLVSSKNPVPVVLGILLEHVEINGLYTEGIYRKSGSANRMKELHQQLEAGPATVSLEDYPIHAVTGLVKQWLRELPEPLLTFTHYNDFLRAVELPEKQEQLQAIYKVLEQLPTAHFNTLERLVFHLVRVAKEEKSNRMTPNSLAIVFAPCILRCPDSADPLLSMKDVAKTTTCVEMLLLEQIRRYNEKMEEIEQLEYAEALAVNQLKLKRKHTCWPLPLRFITPYKEVAIREKGVSDLCVVPENEPLDSDTETERSLIESIKSIKQEKEDIACRLPDLEQPGSDQENLDSEASVSSESLLDSEVSLNMAALSAWFWNERFWLPHNVTWADLADPAPGVEYPKAGHLLSALPLALGIFAVRILFERFIAGPCASVLQIQTELSRRAQPNAVLEKVFTSITKCPDSRRLEGLSKQLDWDERKIQRWFRHRRNQDKPSTRTKFCESMWRFTFYLGVFTYGIHFLWQSPWMWDTRQCWYNYPYQVLSSGLYYYYTAELAFYWSLMFSQFIDIKRKDFLIMFIHHLATIGLISFSYVNNMVRVGSLVMCVHDASDFLLEAAKLANYAKYQRLCDVTFVVFAVIFFWTRLFIFPFWILNTTLLESWQIIGPYPSWWLFNCLLLVLQVLHLIWSYLIARIAIKAVTRGKTWLLFLSGGALQAFSSSPPVLSRISSFTLSAKLCLALFLSGYDRSDIESSSEEETESTPKERLKAPSPRGENGSNGHFGSKPWSQNHNDW